MQSGKFNDSVHPRTKASMVPANTDVYISVWNKEELKSQDVDCLNLPRSWTSVDYGSLRRRVGPFEISADGLFWRCGHIGINIQVLNDCLLRR